MANTVKFTTFENGLTKIHQGGESLALGLATVAHHIRKAKTYKAQSELIKLAAQAYKAFKINEAQALGAKDYALSDESARKAIIRACKKGTPDFKALPSDEPKAVQKRKERGTGKALKGGTKPAQKRPSEAVATTRQQALDISLKTIHAVSEKLQSFTPANSKERKELLAAFTALETTIAKILK